jgi:glycerol uptake facilitator-like aquaporin
VGLNLTELVTVGNGWTSQDEGGKRFHVYCLSQILGAIAGVALSNAIYEKTIFGDSTITRSGNGIFIGEVLATAGLALDCASLSKETRVSCGLSANVDLWCNHL